MIDALKGYHVWSETYDRKWTDFLSILDEITLTVARSLTAEIGLSQPFLTKKSTDNVAAWLLVIEGAFHLDRNSREDATKAINLAKRAIEIDPDYSDACNLLANALIMNARHRWAKSPKESMNQAKEMVLKAIEVDDSNGFAHHTLGEMHLVQRNYDDALVEYKKAVDLNPNDAFAHYRLARCMAFAGQRKEALPIIKEAMRLNPHYQWYYPSVLGRIYFHTGRYDEALTEFEKILEICSKGKCWMYFPHVYLAMLYGKLGSDKPARYHMEKVLEYNPRFNLEARRRASLFQNKEDTDREMEALRKAGAPERPPSQ